MWFLLPFGGFFHIIFGVPFLVNVLGLPFLILVRLLLLLSGCYYCGGIF